MLVFTVLFIRCSMLETGCIRKGGGGRRGSSCYSQDHNRLSCVLDPGMIWMLMTVFSDNIVLTWHNYDNALMKHTGRYPGL